MKVISQSLIQSFGWISLCRVFSNLFISAHILLKSHSVTSPVFCLCSNKAICCLITSFSLKCFIDNPLNLALSDFFKPHKFTKFLFGNISLAVFNQFSWTAFGVITIGLLLLHKSIVATIVHSNQCVFHTQTPQAKSQFHL